ncbi:hypothetical protein Thiowin_04522 [Thiorhodovibrio winogradskyi]|uniref:DUF4351 domain-containing protein n=1 Tax=Thiorhodovibrio winogradskyi TaxID=77007 RepID=A0ABZ0SED3_9GAMM|nr:DUF2887 domain-containing protein [Thiorhodovibrio winogradskyi]
MKTDHPIYLFLSAGAEAFRVLTGGMRLEGAYRFSSTTLRTVERRLDGLLEPEGHAGPVYVVEFQGQGSERAGYNLLAKIGLYGEQCPTRDVIGIGVFLREGDVPGYPGGLCTSPDMVRIVILEQILPDWLAREPENPYLAVFAPLLIEDEAELRARAPELWQGIQTAPLPPDARELLSQVMEFWFFERFCGLTAQEIWAMLNLVTPIQETRAYQSIFAEGKVEGEAKGEAKGKANTLKRQIKRRFGRLSTAAEQRIDAAAVAQLDVWLDDILDTDSVDSLLGKEL